MSYIILATTYHASHSKDYDGVLIESRSRFKSKLIMTRNFGFIKMSNQSPDHHIYYPYTIGENSPISYLFEKISPYVADSGFNITALSIDKDNTSEHGNINGIFAYEPRSLKRKLIYLYSSLRDYDIIHTGGFVHRHHRLRRILGVRNKNISHIHSFRIDVKPDEVDDRTKQLVNMADSFTAVSKHTAKTVKKNLGVKPTTIYNGVDIKTFHPDFSEPELYDSLGDNIFIYVGSFYERKRPQDVVEVAKEVPEAQFAMFGDGPLLDQVRQEADNIENLNVFGRVSKSKLPSLYSNSSALLFPSVREGCPNVVLESLACGTPVIGYQATSMPELIHEDETGYLADPKEVNGLITLTKRILKRKKSLGSSCRRYIKQNHLFSDIAEEYIQVYNEL